MTPTKKGSNRKELKSLKASELKIGIVVSEWHHDITSVLEQGAIEYLLSHGVDSKNIKRITVPGSYELPLAAQWQLEQGLDASICLGCVIKGETMHFDFICNAVAQGLKDVGLKYSRPVAFGVITPNNLKQAWQRAGGKHGHKGVEAAQAVMGMLAIKPQSK